MPGRTVLTFIAVAVVALIFTTPATAAEGPAANETGAAATSYLHTVQPAVIAPGDELVLKGVVENTGDEPLFNVQALPRWNTVQLETRDEVNRVATDETVRWGIRYNNPYQVVAERLNPGETAEFELKINVDDMGFGNAGVYAIGVDIRGSLSNNDRLTLDTSRTVVPWMPDGEPPPPVEVAMVWPVEAPSSLLPDGELRNDAMADRIATDGPLDAVVSAAGSSPLTWLVDPDVLDTVDTMAGRTGDGTSTDDQGTDDEDDTEEGTDDGTDEGDTEPDEEAAAASDGEAAASGNVGLARSWRSSFDAATTGNGADSDVFLLPYARPDVDALLTSNSNLASQLSAASVEATRETARNMDGVRTGVTQPADGAASDEALSLLADSGVRTVILSGSAVSPSEHPLARMNTPRGDLDVVLTDPGLDSAVADAYTASNTEAGLLDFRQRWVAETAMVSLEAQALGEAPPPLVVTPPSRWTPSTEVATAVVDAWTSVPWVEPTKVSDLDAPAQPATVTAAPIDTANVLPPENVAATGELRDAVKSYTELLTDPDPALSRSLGLVAIRSASSGWRDDPAAGIEYTSEITEDIDEQLDDVQVTVPESVTLSSRTGIFPLTVTNDLDRPVTVKLAIKATNPDRLRVDEVPEQRIEAGSRQTIEIQAKAATNGRVPITIQLVTNNGSPMGPVSQSVVHATDYGTIGWVIIGGAAALFGAAVVRTMLRRRAAQTEGQNSIDTEPEDSGRQPDHSEPDSQHQGDSGPGKSPAAPAPEVTR